MKTISLITLFIFTFIPFTIYSQWSSNPSVNSTVCDTVGEQALVKIATTQDGGCYVSWFDARNGIYAVYLQKLNSQGIKLFPNSGLLISNNPQGSSLVDYDLAVDDSNCAVIAFTDTRNSSSINPFAYRISPTGQFLWGTNGINLTDSINAYQANPKIILTSDENYVITWQYENKIAMQKINKAGIKQWGNAPLMLIGNPAISEKFNYPTGVKSDNGNYILYWIGYTGSFLSPSNYKIYSQKYSPSGTPLWSATQDTIYNLGNGNGVYQPAIFTDGNNGAIYVWQDFRTGNSNCYVQRKNSAGQIQFPVNGSDVAVSPYVMLRFAPAAAYMPSTQETYVFWQQKNTLQSLIGVYGQKFSSTGTRLWNDTGVAFKPLDQNSFSSLQAIVKDTNIIAYYDESLFGSANCLIKAFRINRNGAFGWGGSIITPSTILSEKIRLNATMNNNNMSMLAWEDRRNDGGGIYAQNINYDGSFGAPVGVINPNENIPEKFVLYQNYPNPFNPVTIIRYSIPENEHVNIKIYDILGRELLTLINDRQNAGTYEVKFDGLTLSSGIYFYKLATDKFSEIKSMVLLK